MKNIFVFLMLFGISSCSYKEEYKEDYNYLPNNSIRFIKTKEDTSLLINKDNIYYLLLLGDQNININVDYLIKTNNNKVNIKSGEEYYLKDTLTINDVTFRKNDKIEVIMNNKKLCIYKKELNKDNFSSCDFIYFYKIDYNFYITLNSNITGLFIDSYTKFNYRFMYHLSTVWIDSYSIDENTYTTLTIYKDNFEVTTSERRGKTIHKKENS